MHSTMIKYLIYFFSVWNKQTFQVISEKARPILTGGSLADDITSKLDSYYFIKIKELHAKKLISKYTN